jgi:hypothetical protein
MFGSGSRAQECVATFFFFFQQLQKPRCPKNRTGSNNFSFFFFSVRRSYDFWIQRKTISMSMRRHPKGRRITGTHRRAQWRAEYRSK